MKGLFIPDNHHDADSDKIQVPEYLLLAIIDLS
jgi:hypothetical protein